MFYMQLQKLSFVYFTYSASTEMERSGPPRKRAKNWDEEEKEYLLDLIRDRVKFIEDKRTDGETNRKKTAAWQEVHRSFTEMYGKVPRTLKQLKDQWKHMKISAKKNFSHCQKKGAEAGEPPPRAPSELDTEVHLLLKAETKQLDDDEDEDDDNENIGPPLHGESTESESKSW